jgi:hypothetical protein
MSASGKGEIRGKVHEGPRPQPNLLVTLVDERGKEVARTKTQADGTTGMQRVWFTLAVLIVSVAGMSGCGGDSRFVESFYKVKGDGTESVADVEKTIGSKGKEILNSDIAKEDNAATGNVFADRAEMFKGKRKLGKGKTANDVTVPDENGMEVKWIRWDEGGASDKYIYVAVLEDKVFLKLAKGSWRKRQ